MQLRADSQLSSDLKLNACAGRYTEIERENRILLEKGIVGGYEAGRDYQGCEHDMIVAVTEMTTDHELNLLIDALKGIA